MDKILKLLKKCNVSQSDETLKRLILGVVSAPKPMADARKNAWLSLFDGAIDDEMATQLNVSLDELRAEYNPDLQDGFVPSSRKQAAVSAVQDLGLEGTIVTLTDEYQGEYLPDQARRLYWLTGFSGSAGLCFVGTEKSAIFVDGRYTVQVTEQVNPKDYEYRHLVNEPIADWIIANYQAGARVGFNALTMSDSQARGIQVALESAGITLVPLIDDPIDGVWENQPPKPITPIEPYAIDKAGKSTADKHDDLRNTLKRHGAYGGIVCLPDSFCWLLNVRGGDVPCTPFVHGYMVVTNDEIHAFVDNAKIPKGLQLDATVHDLTHWDTFLKNTLRGKTVLLDPVNTPYQTAQILRDSGATLKHHVEICQLPKACKNSVEIAGTRQAHIVDGVAMVKFLHWLDSHVALGTLTELSCSDMLTEIRQHHPDMRDISFNPISGVAGNGAICHYRVTEETSQPLTLNTLYLIDSGGQYEYGTTDITRTIALGDITDEMRDRATRVLKGMIALHQVKFPVGTSGMNLDILARQYLFDGGYNFDHGTGHGVGCYLSVHEGPARIGQQQSPVALKPGMILSNEPGYYKAGEYGIRLENLIVVTEPDESCETPMMSFENLTWCPLDKRLFDKSMLTDGEIAWLNEYHKTTWDTLSPHIQDREVRGWFKNATSPL